MAEWTVTIRGPEGAVKLTERLRDTRPVLAKIGALTLAQAKGAFRAQRLGHVVWPERYPKQKGPFINIAPVVMYAGRGQTPVADDFRKRPALIGHAPYDLMNKLSARIVSDDEVEVGHPDEWSGRFQHGGLGRIPITETTRQTIFKWLFGNRAGAGGSAPSARKSKKAHATEGEFESPIDALERQTGKKAEKVERGTKADYARKLAFVFWRDELVQKTYPRPFLGMTDQLNADIDEAVARHLGAKPGSGGEA